MKVGAVGQVSLREFMISILPGLLIVIVIQSLAISFFDVPIYGDSEEYMLLGRNLHESGHFSFDGVSPSRMRQPVYPAFLSLTYFALGQSFLIVKLFQALLGLISFTVIMKLYQRVCGTQHLRLATLGIGLYVPLWWNCAIILSEPIAILLIAGFLLVLYDLLLKWDLWKCIIAGLLLGIAILTRPISIALLLLVWFPIASSSRLHGKRLMTLATVVVSCLVVLSPWAIRNYISCGVMTPLSSEGEYHASRAADFAAELPKDSVVTWDAVRDSHTNPSVLGVIASELRDHPVKFLWNSTKRVIGTWSYFPGSRNYFDYLPARIAAYVVQIVLLLVAVFGLSKLDRDKKLFLIFPAISFSIIIFFSSEGISRLLLPIMPAVLIAAAIGAASIIDSWHRRTRTVRP